MMAWESSSGVSGPKFMVPRQNRLTMSPSRPRCVYSMGFLLVGTPRFEQILGPKA